MTTTPRNPVPTGPPTDRTVRLNLRHPEDLLASVPVFLGFWPKDDIVLLTFGGRQNFQARTDLPPAELQTPDLLGRLADTVLEPPERYGATHVILVYYGDDPRAIDDLHEFMRDDCGRRGLSLVSALAVEPTHYRDLEHPEPIGRLTMLPYDISGHPFVLDAIVQGRLTHRSREDLADSLGQDTAAAGGLSAALAAGRWAEAGAPVSGREVRGACARLQAAVRRLVTEDRRPSDEELAALLWTMQSERVRDAAIAEITRSTARDHVELWSDAVRRAPDALVAAPAAVLAWAAWQAGDGALSWIAVDRCLAASPGYRLAEVLGTILQSAIAPSLWNGDLRWTEGVPE